MLSEWLSDLRYRLRAIFRRAAVERDLEDEVRFHLEREAEKLVRAGVTPSEAMRRARVAFGGVERVKEESRDARGVSILDVATQDLRYALRGLRMKPGFTAAVILTLGLGIGANAAMFGVVDRLMFRAPSYLHDPATVHRVYLFSTNRGKESASSSLEYTRYLDLTRWTHSFAQIAGFGYRGLAVGTGDDAREMMVGTVSASFFDFFDAPPVLGRYFSAREDTLPAGAPVVVLSHAFWQTRYGGRADALGSSLQIGRVHFAVIGVAPPRFVGVSEEEPPVAFIPITTFAGLVAGIGKPSEYYTTYSWGWMQMLVRRKPDVTTRAASADLSNAYRRSYEAERNLAPTALALPTLARPRGVAAPVLRQRGPMAGKDAKVVTWISGVALIVLLIACANVANLLLARAQRRRREIALRVALGVGQRRLLSQLLTESVMLGALGGLAGVLVAYWGSRVLRVIFLAKQPTMDVITDWRTLAFAGAVAVTAGVVTGLAPALYAGREDLAAALKAGAREGTYRRSRTRTFLLVFQGALAVMLLVGTGLFVRSLRNVRALRIGYDVDPILYVERNLRGVKLDSIEQRALGQRLEDAARSLPGVENATRALTVPFWNTWSQGLYVPGIDSVRKLGRFTLQAGSPEYFRTVGTRLLRGRGIEASDRDGAPRVVVVSEAMARTLWPGKDAIGQCLHLIQQDTLACSRVVGIAENIKANSLTDDPGLHYYLSIEQFHPGDAGLLIRTRGDAAQYVETVRRRLQEVLPGSAYVTVTTMHEIVDPNERSWRSGATMFAVFSGLALVLAAIGLYSVVAYDVAQRTHELGVRIALGAQSADVLRLVVGAGMRFAAAGIGIGAAIALVAGRWLEPLLYAVSPRDPLVFGVVTVMLFGVALAASALPALRAARVDPNVALRVE